jgi:YD repeat-containing protein
MGNLLSMTDAENRTYTYDLAGNLPKLQMNQEKSQLPTGTILLAAGCGKR